MGDAYKCRVDICGLFLALARLRYLPRQSMLAGELGGGRRGGSPALLWPS